MFFNQIMPKKCRGCSTKSCLYAFVARFNNCFNFSLMLTATAADVIGQSSCRNNKTSVEVAQESPATQTKVGGCRMRLRSDKHKLKANLDHAVASAVEERSHDASEGIPVNLVCD